MPLRHVTRRHARAGSAAAIAPHRFGAAAVGRAAGASAGGRARRGRAAARPRRGVPRKTVSVDETPSAYGSCSAMQRAAQRRVVAEFGIAEHRGHGEAGRADLSQQRQRQAPFLLEPHRRAESGRAAVPRASATPRADTSAAPSIQARTPVHSAAVTATWQLAILPSVPQYWRATPTECGPASGKLVPSRISTPAAIGNHRRAAAARRARRSTAHR